MDESAESALEGRVLDVCVGAHDCGRLASELHDTGFELLARFGGDDGADGGRAGEVYLFHGKVLDSRVGHAHGIFWLVVEDVEDSCGQTGLVKHVSHGPKASWRHFAAFHNGRVAASNGVENSSHSQDVRRVPNGYVSHVTEGSIVPIAHTKVRLRD